jgi:hypothetical protein
VKSNFLKCLNEGRKPWATVIPAYIEMFIKGKSLITISEQNLISNISAIFTSSAKETFELAKVYTAQEDEIEKKYQVKLIGDLYK